MKDRIRIRNASEWLDILRRSDWRPEEWVGSWEMEPFTHLAEKLIVVSEGA